MNNILIKINSNEREAFLCKKKAHNWRERERTDDDCLMCMLLFSLYSYLSPDLKITKKKKIVLFYFHIIHIWVSIAVSCLSFALSCLGWIHTVSLFFGRNSFNWIKQQKIILKYSQQHAPTTFSLFTAVIPFCLVYSKLFNFI